LDKPIELSSSDRDRVALICYATVSHLFATFQNPKNRGPNFTWELFIDIAERHVSTQISLNLLVRKSKMALAEQHARITANAIAKDLVKWASET